MWVFTLDGFYSAVQHRDDPHTLVVRCRDKGDAERLRNHLFLTQRVTAEVNHTPTGDYAYRLFVPRSAWSHYLSSAVEDISYTNFKDAVGIRQGYKRAGLYGHVWATMLSLQEDK